MSSHEDGPRFLQLRIETPEKVYSLNFEWLRYDYICVSAPPEYDLFVGAPLWYVTNKTKVQGHKRCPSTAKALPLPE